MLVFIFLTDELVTINVNKDYPEKELILQDIMDVEYIALETTDEFMLVFIFLMFYQHNHRIGLFIQCSCDLFQFAFQSLKYTMVIIPAKEKWI